MKRRVKQLPAQVIVEYFIVLAALIVAMLAGLLGLRSGIVSGMGTVESEVANDFVNRTTPPDKIINNAEVEYSAASSDLFEDEQANVTVDTSYCYGEDCQEMQEPEVHEEQDQ